MGGLFPESPRGGSPERRFIEAQVCFKRGCLNSSSTFTSVLDNGLVPLNVNPLFIVGFTGKPTIRLKPNSKQLALHRWFPSIFCTLEQPRQYPHVACVAECPDPRLVGLSSGEVGQKLRCLLGVGYLPRECIVFLKGVFYVHQGTGGLFSFAVRLLESTQKRTVGAQASPSHSQGQQNWL